MAVVAARVASSELRLASSAVAQEALGFPQELPFMLYLPVMPARCAVGHGWFSIHAPDPARQAHGTQAGHARHLQVCATLAPCSLHADSKARSLPGANATNKHCLGGSAGTCGIRVTLAGSSGPSAHRCCWPTRCAQWRSLWWWVIRPPPQRALCSMRCVRQAPYVAS